MLSPLNARECLAGDREEETTASHTQSTGGAATSSSDSRTPCTACTPSRGCTQGRPHLQDCNEAKRRRT
eukprot:10944264-Prorocentrum_lima.AAC.1